MGFLNGSVQLIYAANQIAAPLVAGGQLRALAKLDRRARRAMADIPTLSVAAGLPDRGHVGLARPRRAQGDAEADHRQAAPESRADSRGPRRAGAIRADRQLPVTSTPEEFEAFIRKEADRWSAVLKETGIKFDWRRTDP